MPKNKTRQRYANVSNAHIEALLGGYYVFGSEKLASDKLALLEKHFITSNSDDETPDKPCLMIWIEGFGLTKDDESKGALGNYAFVAIVKNEAGEYALEATRLSINPSKHPKRKRRKQRHPNWGHPVLRSAKKGRKYDTLEEVESELKKLQEEYPDITIPGKGKLSLIIFDRKADPKNPAQKYVLTIKSEAQGKYYLQYDRKIHTPHKKKKKQPPPTTEEPKSPEGQFTAKIALERHRKK